MLNKLAEADADALTKLMHTRVLVKQMVNSVMYWAPDTTSQAQLGWLGIINGIAAIENKVIRANIAENGLIINFTIHETNA